MGKKVIPKEHKDVIVEVVQEQSIYEKYKQYIVMAREGYLRNWRMSEIEDIHRHVESVLGHKYYLNLNCSMCVIDLVNIFARLKDLK